MKTPVLTKGFTLIELLIVVAIIAILAAIAVPNFLEAQTRSKVSRSQADLRTLATAVEAYQVDNNVYPMIVAPNSPFLGRPGAAGSGINGPSVFNPDPSQGAISSRFIWLTTPIAYITSVFRDPFIPANVNRALDEDGDVRDEYDTYDYVDARSLWPGGILGGNRGAAGTSGAQWHVVGCGPDRRNCFGAGQSNYNQLVRAQGVDYDPTNGTVSPGDLVRFGGGPGPVGTLLPAIDRIQNKYNAVPDNVAIP